MDTDKETPDPEAEPSRYNASAADLARIWSQQADGLPAQSKGVDAAAEGVTRLAAATGEYCPAWDQLQAAAAAQKRLLIEHAYAFERLELAIEAVKRKLRIASAKAGPLN